MTGSRTTAESHDDAIDITVVVPTRNAEYLLEPCLTSIVRNRPAALIVVDGNSTDATVDIAKRFGAQVLSDDGKGLPVARALGAKAATTERVALVDADVIVPDGSLGALVEEFDKDGYSALQAGLHSVASGGYWGQALAWHHRTGRSRKWFGLVATVFDRAMLLEHGFDERFLSGEDIEMRWRLRQAGAKIGVSERVVVTHRFADDSFEFAADQFRADGEGLGRMVRKHGLRGLRLLALPGAGAVRGILVALAHRQPRWIPYFVTFGAMNYVSMLRGLLERPETQEPGVGASA